LQLFQAVFPFSNLLPAFSGQFEKLPKNCKTKTCADSGKNGNFIISGKKQVSHHAGRVERSATLSTTPASGCACVAVWREATFLRSRREWRGMPFCIYILFL